MKSREKKREEKNGEKKQLRSIEFDTSFNERI
jgi:hypothetical protein